MKKILMAFVMMAVSRMVAPAVDAQRSSLVHWGRLRMAFLYIRTIKTTRLLFISLLGMGLCLLLALCGFVLFHVGLFVYSPWSPQFKMSLAFFCAALYFGLAALFFYKIFSQRQWLNMFHAQHIINQLRKKNQAHADPH